MVMLSFVLFRGLRTASFSLILCMTFAETMLPLIYFQYPPKDDTWECQLQGWWNQFFTMFSLYFSSVIAFHMYKSILDSSYKLTGNMIIYRIVIGE